MKNFNVLLIIILLGLSWQCSKKEKEIQVNSLQEISENLAPTIQTFEVDPTKESLIKGESGTVVFIPSNAFQFEDGSSPIGQVQIELKECYSWSDILSENLHTVSEGKILETGGMVYVNATSDGKQLSLKKGVAYVVGFPKGQEEEMQLFYPKYENDSTFTWIPDYQFTGNVEKANQTAIPPQADTNVDYSEPTADMVRMYPDSMYYVALWIDTITWTPSLDMFKTNADTNGIWNNWFHAIVIPDSVYRNEKSISPSEQSKHLLTVRFKVKDNSLIDVRSTDNNGILSQDILDIVNNHVKSSMSNSEIIKFGLKDGQHQVQVVCKAFYSYILNKEKLKSSIQNKYKPYVKDAVESISADDLEMYMFAATELGWINCDRFWEYQGEKSDLIVSSVNTNDLNVRLLFKDIRSMMTPELVDGRYIFKDIPIGSEVKIVGISYQNGKPTLAVNETKVGQAVVKLNEFHEFSLSKLERELNSL